MQRRQYLDLIFQIDKSGPGCIGLLGPRQCGKTTLAKQYAKEVKTVTYFDLEDPIDLAKLNEPKLALENLEGLVIIDEIQRRPDLFPILRVLLDKKPKKRRFLILGSASQQLIKQSSESLAGRISYIEMSPFSLKELYNKKEHQKLWLRGGFPLSLLAKSNDQSLLWRKNYISTFLERDIPQLGIEIPSLQLRRFWTMLSHYHGQTWNSSEIGRSLGVADTTTRRYLDILTGTFMIRQIYPWYANIGKRVVKAPKIYFRDTGILHTLLSIENKNDLQNHPKLGASWEGFALEQFILSQKLEQQECYYWGVHGQSELDLFIPHLKFPIGYEVKYTGNPTITTSMKSAIEDLNLYQLYIIYPGTETFQLSKKVTAIPLREAIKL